MTLYIGGETDVFPNDFRIKAHAVLEKADLRGDIDFIAMSKDRFLCIQTVTIRVANSGLRSKIVSYFDFCANTITTSHYQRTSYTLDKEGTIVDTITPVNILAYNSLPENNPYRRDMDVLKNALDAGLTP